MFDTCARMPCTDGDQTRRFTVRSKPTPVAAAKYREAGVIGLAGVDGEPGE